jgi:hypothetical protein
MFKTYNCIKRINFTVLLTIQTKQPLPILNINAFFAKKVLWAGLAIFYPEMQLIGKMGRALVLKKMKYEIYR